MQSFLPSFLSPSRVTHSLFRDPHPGVVQMPSPTNIHHTALTYIAVMHTTYLELSYREFSSAWLLLRHMEHSASELRLPHEKWITGKPKVYVYSSGPWTLQHQPPTLTSFKLSPAVTHPPTSWDRQLSRQNGVRELAQLQRTGCE